MKKFLSLVLALVMTMSLVTVSAGAKDFEDNDEINYEAAVAVMSEIGVLGGYADGSFNPDGNLTRQAAAKIICNMILGPTTAKALRADTAPFKDVPVTSEFSGYITYCAQQGILNGYADGSFRPGAPLTGYAFMKMLLGALGYDGAIEGYVGPNWSVQVAKRAIGIGLNAGLKTDFNGVKTVTREEACLYAFNALQSTMVEYDSRTTVSVGGADVVIAGSAAKEVAQNGYKNTMDAANLQFAEKYFGKLSKEATTDDFGRPAHEWIYNKDYVGCFVDYTTFVTEYTTEVTGRELYDLLGKSVLSNNELAVYIDGVDDASVNPAVFDVTDLTKTNKAGVGATGNGVLTQVFFDKDNSLITVAIINTYLASADNDYNDRKETVTLSLNGVKTASGEYVKHAGPSGTDTVNVVVSSDDFAVEDVEKGEWFLVTIASGEVITMAKPEMVEETTIRSFKKGVSVNAAGETYEYSSSVTYDKTVLDAYDDNNMKETTYNLFLDEYGYMIGVEIVAAESHYVFITGYESFDSVLTNAKTEARAIFLDGTVDTITVKNAAETKDKNGAYWYAKHAAGEDNENGWYTYSTDKNGNYTLTPVAASIVSGVTKVAQGQDVRDGLTIDKAHVSLKVTNGAGTPVNSYGNDDTVFMGARLKTLGTAEQITGVTSVTTGVKNVKMELDVDGTEPNGAYVLYKDNGYVIAAIVVGKDLAVSSNYAYIIDGVSQEDYDDEADEYTWHRAAIIDGQEVILKERGSNLTLLGGTGKGNMYVENWYVVYYDADGYVVDTQAVDYEYTAGADAVNGVYEFNTIAAFEKEDVVLVKQIMGKADANRGLVFNGHTLYTYTDMAYDTGIDVMPGAKAVLYTTDNGDIQYFDEDAGNVQAALDEMEALKFNGEVYFVMTDGVASTVIIVYRDALTGAPAPGTPAGKVKAMTFDANGWVNVFSDVAMTTRPGADVEVTLYQLRDNGYVEVGSYIIPAADGYVCLGGNMNTGDTYKVVCGAYSKTVVSA